MNSMFLGTGPQEFSYSTTTLQEAILRELERNEYAGVCCEPNMVFVVCNQFPVGGALGLSTSTFSMTAC